MHSVCCCSLLVWRRSFLKKRTPLTYFCPALDPPLDGSGRKTTTLVRDLEYFIHTKFHQNPSSGSGEEVENVNSLTDDGRTDAGQRVITIGHWSLWLLCPKNIYVWETLPATKSQKGIFKVNIKVIRKGLISGVCMPNKVSIMYGSKIIANVKVDDRQTDRTKNMPLVILPLGIKTK